MPESAAALAKRRAYNKAYKLRQRAAARAATAATKDALDAPAPAEVLAPPVFLSLDDPLPSASPPPAALPPAAPLPPAPTAAELLDLAPLPLPPEHRPFSFADPDVFTPAELQAITEFNALYMQPPGLRAYLMALPPPERLPTLARIKATARGTDGTNGILAYLRKQYRLACRGVGGAQSQEAQQVQRNLQWVEQELLKGEDV